MLANLVKQLIFVNLDLEEKSKEIQSNISVLNKYDWKIVGETFNSLLLDANK